MANTRAQKRIRDFLVGQNSLEENNEGVGNAPNSSNNPTIGIIINISHW